MAHLIVTCLSSGFLVVHYRFTSVLIFAHHLRNSTGFAFHGWLFQVSLVRALPFVSSNEVSYSASQAMLQPFVWSLSLLHAQNQRSVIWSQSWNRSATERHFITIVVQWKQPSCCCLIPQPHDHWGQIVFRIHLWQTATEFVQN